MYKKKWIYLSLLAAVIAFSILGALYFVNSNKEYSSFITLGCDASMYEQKSGVGYLTIVCDTLKSKREIIVKVEDVNLQNSLSESELENIIGVNLELTIPYKVLNNQHIDVNTFNPFEYLTTDTFDEYLVLLEVFYK